MKRWNFTVQQALPWILIIGGLIGILCTSVILVDKIKLLEDPAFQPGCDINPIISCGSVMQSDQASALGVPNIVLGLAAFPVVVTTGVVMLAGAQFKRWYMLAFQFGTILGIFFVHWLFAQSVYVLDALCPYCIGIWIVTITMFWYTLVYNLRTGVITLGGAWKRVGTFIQKHHLDILFVWFLIIFVLIMQHFWYYYGEFLR